VGAKLKIPFHLMSGDYDTYLIPIYLISCMGVLFLSYLSGLFELASYLNYGYLYFMPL
jgi:hypothetical protein